MATQDLLKFWFKESHIETRYVNFHEGQKQAILNAIYLHEVLGTKTVKDVYNNIEFELLPDIDIAELKKAKYEMPKYAIKMATGTGKTWVMHALLIWQYLSAKYETEKSGKFTKNFLLVAPGIIVYERLLDAYLGKENEKQERQFEQSDFYKFRDLFIPPNYRDDVFGFIQNSVAKKQEIGTKATGDGLIAIANWHLFLDREEVDFSATPYDVTGSGQKRIKHYFPHIIVDFDLRTAIRGGLVKTIAIDKRKEFTDIQIDFAAKRENKKVIALSDGQMLMLRAGLNRLNILQQHFVEFTKDKNGITDKYPKMLIMCENTDVAPLVVDFLKEEGLSEEDIIRVDSNKKGEIPEKEWLELKQKLFNIDKRGKPRVIASVLMLREGFDVNNICVIVSLRSSSAPILLEQTIGRGLRLMWREPEYKEFRQENIKRLLYEKKEPVNYLDLLFIVEHPAFLQFYDDLDKEILPEIEKDENDRGDVLGDIIKVGLKENYEEYDLFWPLIIKESEEKLVSGEAGIEKLESFVAYSLEDLKRFFNKEGEQFAAEELTVKTRFGEYSVDANLFKSQSYNEYLENP